MVFLYHFLFFCNAVYYTWHTQIRYICLDCENVVSIVWNIFPFVLLLRTAVGGRRKLLFYGEKKLAHKGSRKIQAFAEIFWEEEQWRSAGVSGVLSRNDRSIARCDDGVRNK